MPITASAKKALRKSARNRQRNSMRKKGLRDAILAFRKNIVSGSRDEATTALRHATRALDKAAKTNVIRKQAAARKKSRLARLLANALAK